MASVCGTRRVSIVEYLVGKIKSCNRATAQPHVPGPRSVYFKTLALHNYAQKVDAESKPSNATMPHADTFHKMKRRPIALLNLLYARSRRQAYIR